MRSASGVCDQRWLRLRQYRPDPPHRRSHTENVGGKNTRVCERLRSWNFLLSSSTLILLRDTPQAQAAENWRQRKSLSRKRMSQNYWRRKPLCSPWRRSHERKSPQIWATPERATFFVVPSKTQYDWCVTRPGVQQATLRRVRGDMDTNPRLKYIGLPRLVRVLVFSMDNACGHGYYHGPLPSGMTERHRKRVPLDKRQRPLCPPCMA